MRTSGTVMTTSRRTSSSTSPRAKTAASTWRTSSPTRSMRWDGPVGRLFLFISPDYAFINVSSIGRRQLDALAKGARAALDDGGFDRPGGGLRRLESRPAPLLI